MLDKLHPELSYRLKQFWKGRSHVPPGVNRLPISKAAPNCRNFECSSANTIPSPGHTEHIGGHVRNVDINMDISHRELDARPPSCCTVSFWRGCHWLDCCQKYLKNETYRTCKTKLVSKCYRESQCPCIPPPAGTSVDLRRPQLSGTQRRALT